MQIEPAPPAYIRPKRGGSRPSRSRATKRGGSQPISTSCRSCCGRPDWIPASLGAIYAAATRNAHEDHCKSCHRGRLFLLGLFCNRPIDGSGSLTAISTLIITVLFASRITSTTPRSGIFLFMDPPILAIQLAIRSMECVVPLVSFFRSSFRTAYAERLAGSLTPAASRRPGLSRNWARLKTVR